LGLSAEKERKVQLVAHLPPNVPFSFPHTGETQISL
jgi:hypothetical protein